MYYIDGMPNELMRLGYKWEGMSKRVRLKEEAAIQIHIFPNKEGAWYPLCKNDNVPWLCRSCRGWPLEHKRASAKGVRWLLG